MMLSAVAASSWAVDDATIQVLQSDVVTNKMKTDDHEVKIKNLEGGLPAEQGARIAAERPSLEHDDDED